MAFSIHPARGPQVALVADSGWAAGPEYLTEMEPCVVDLAAAPGYREAED